MDINILTLSGRLTADPEIRTGKVEWSRFSIAVGSSKKINGEWASETDFFNCVSFGRNAKHLASTKKGDAVVVVGRLKQNNYINKDGQKVQSVQIVAESVNLLKNNITDKTQNEIDKFDQQWPSDQEIPF